MLLLKFASGVGVRMGMRWNERWGWSWNGLEGNAGLVWERGGRWDWGWGDTVVKGDV